MLETARQLLETGKNRGRRPTKKENNSLPEANQLSPGWIRTIAICLIIITILFLFYPIILKLDRIPEILEYLKSIDAKVEKIDGINANINTLLINSNQVGFKLLPTESVLKVVTSPRHLEFFVPSESVRKPEEIIVIESNTLSLPKDYQKGYRVLEWVLHVGSVNKDLSFNNPYEVKVEVQPYEVEHMGEVSVIYWDTKQEKWETVATSTFLDSTGRLLIDLSQKTRGILR